MRQDHLPPDSLSRRRFLRNSVASGAAVGTLPLLNGCGSTDGGVRSRSTELRTQYFDLSHADPSHSYHLVVGTRHQALVPATAAHRVAARTSNPSLQGVADSQITHVAENVVLPGDDIQVLWVKGVRPGQLPTDRGWLLHHLYFHIPTSTQLPAGAEQPQSCGKPLISQRAAFNQCTVSGISAASAISPQSPMSDYSYCDDPRYDNYKSFFDNAIAAICTHPELLSFDATSLTLIHQIICADRTTLDLAVSIYRQGADWCTITPEVDASTGQPALDRNGKPVLKYSYSATTKQLLGLALRSILPKVKDDLRFGANITNADSTQATSALQGTLWSIKNSQPSRVGGTAPSLAARVLRGMSGGLPTWTPTNVCDGYGFRIDNISGNQQTLTFAVHNWFVRHLGLYVRFIGSDGVPLNIFSDVTPNLNQDTEAQTQFTGLVSSLITTGAYGFLDVISPEYTVFGIPVAEAKQSFTVTIPKSASSVEIIACGLGHGAFPDEPSLIAAGTAFTGLFEFLVPTMLLAYGAYGGYTSFQNSSLGNNNLRNAILVALFKSGLSASIAIAGRDPIALLGAAQSVGKALITAETQYLAPIVAEAIAEGEAEAAIEDFIPFGIGLILEAVEALGLVASIAEATAEVIRSPWTYTTTVVGTHDLTVTIKPDPTDTAGFPATATRYRIRAYFDKKSGGDSGELLMPAGTLTTPITYTFRNVPYGGKVMIEAVFYSDSGWLAGSARCETDAQQDNTQDSVTITLKENLVPLSADTIYRHREKLALDSSGRRVWNATTTAPASTDGNLSNDNTPGSLAELVGISVSERFGAIGYSWRAYSSGITNQAGAQGQWYQFGNVSFTQTPQSGYLAPAIGFSAPVRLAYDLKSNTSNNFYVDPSNGQNLVRRIVTTAVNTPPAAEGPGSNLAVGRFNYPSDAFLVHPTGVLVSINAGQHCIEVLRPSTTPTADTQAQVANVRSSLGTREGLINGPVCAAIAPNGAILVLEAGNQRIQAFDTDANPVRMFTGNSSSFLMLRPEAAGATFLDVAMESVGFVYVLYKSAALQVVLDIYSSNGDFVCSTSNLNAAKLTVDLFRNIYTLNYEVLQPVGSITEPTISQWIPSTPPGTSVVP